MVNSSNNHNRANQWKKEENQTASQAIAKKGMATNLPCPLPLRHDQRPICKIWRSFPEPHLPSGGIHVFIQIRVLEVNISPFLPFLSEFKRLGILEEKITFFHYFPFFYAMDTYTYLSLCLWKIFDWCESLLEITVFECDGVL